jgi:hypothetical protein
MTFDQLTRLDREAGRIAANDNHLDAVFDKPKIDTDDTPAGPLEIHAGLTAEECQARRAADRAAARARLDAEKARMAPVRAALAERQSLGDPSADNDNETWPLLTSLRREGDNDSIATVLQYRQLVALCACQPLQGQRIPGGTPVVHRSTNLEKETEAALAKIGPTSDSLPGGEIKYKEVKKKKGGTFHLPAQQAVATNDETRVRTAPVAIPFNDELLIRQLDAKPVLKEVRAALGPLLDPFEDAVLGGKTYTDIGRKEDASVKPDVAGKALVKRAIIAAEGVLYDIGQRIRRAERESEKRASMRRCEIAIEKAMYFGRAA